MKNLAVFLWLYLICLFVNEVGSITFANYSSQLQTKIGQRASFLWEYKLGSNDILISISFGFTKKSGKAQAIAGKEKGKELKFTNTKYKKRFTIDADDISKAHLHINSVTLDEDNDAQFSCTIEILNSEERPIANTLLEVIYGPTFLYTPKSSTVREFTNLELACKVRGKPKPNIRWFKNGFPNVIRSQELTFNRINRSSTGNYTCVASNVVNSISYTVSVIVQYEPEINLKESSTRVGTYLGNSKPVYLICAADGFPQPTYIWNNPRGHEETGRSVGKFGQFALQEPTKASFGTYTCLATNDLGSKQHKITLYEIGKPDPVTIVISDIKDRSIVLTITLPKNTGNSTLQELTLSYKKSGGVVKNVVLDLNLTTQGISYLKPFSDYELNVTVKNEYFESNGQKKTFKTKQAAPGPPTNIVLFPLSPYRMNVTWGAPSEPNGIISRYALRFFQKGLGSFQNATMQTMFLKMFKLEVNLIPDTEYVAYVRASTVAGHGVWSNKVEMLTEPEVSGVPRNVTIKALNYNTISLRWLAPSYLGGTITKYGFKLRFLSKETLKRGESNLVFEPDPRSRRYYQFNDMLPFTDYEVMIREGAGNKPVWGNYSKPITVSMPEGPPSTPEGFRVLAHTHTALHLRWNRPRHVNGILTKFVIRYTNSSASYTTKLSKDLNNYTFFYSLGYLKANTEYKVNVRAYTQNQVSNPSEMRTVQTLVAGGDVTGGKEDKDSTNIGAILGAVLPIMFITVAVVLIVLYILRHKRIKSRNNSSSSSSGFMKLESRDSSPIHLVDGSKPTKVFVPPPSNGFIENENAKTNDKTFAALRPISVPMLKEYVARCHGGIDNKDKGFIDEMRSIKVEGDFTFEVSMKADNKCKNRYANILAYDHSRVVLNTVENLKSSDYVNANYIDGYNRKAKFIATQGPVVAAFNDFWRMVWEQNTYTIVMVTNLVERSRIKCQKYWPSEAEKSQVHGNIQVYSLDEMELADYVIRRFRISLMKDDNEIESRQITQYQFTSWPDHGVPQFATGLLQFIKRIHSASSESSGPLVIHCSAGVGRTGTYITLDAMLDQIEIEKKVDVFGFVMHIRSQRNLMVQTEAQYVFIYNALLESVSCGNTEISTSDLVQRIKHLSTLNPGTARTYLEEEFERLSMNLDDSTLFISSILPCNKVKNRFPDIMPYESSRVKLWPYPNAEGSDYMNASFVDGYQQREAYILTQAPMENTIHDFWRMLWEYEVFSVVMISSSKERDMHHCYPYWPVNNEPALFGLLRMQVVSEEEKTGYVKREFKVSNSKNGESRIISHFMYFDWPIDGAPDSTSIIEMIGQLQKTQQQTGNSSIVIHCSDGSGRSGALSALMYCLERLKLEGVVDVFQTVRSMRTQRTELVQTLPQYHFIYQAVRNFLDCFSNYANFK